MFTAADIMRGFLPKELPPPFTSTSLTTSLGSLPISNSAKKHSKLAYHSSPKSKTSRRLLSIPNPLHQLRLAEALEANAHELLQKQADSPISLSSLVFDSDSDRTLRRAVPMGDLGVQRMLRAAGLRFALRTDLSRYYQTIYSHSIPWAIHGKDTAKADRSHQLYGNLLDTCVRNAQDQQTLGIPVGPTSSDLIAETVGAALDRQLRDRLGLLRGTRYVDDFHLYFSSRSDAEAGLAAVEQVAKEFELELNATKTEVGELPETTEPEWLTNLRAMQLRPELESQRFDLLALFNTAFNLLRAWPAGPILKYVIKQTVSAVVEPDNWSIYESLLCHTLMADPVTLPLVTQILLHYRNEGYTLDPVKIGDTLSEIVSYHAPLNHGFEVAWSLWLSSVLSIQVAEKTAGQVSAMEDPIVILVALDTKAKGWISDVDSSRWEAMMRPDELYSENWLVAYEALVQGWLSASDVFFPDYLSDDEFFGRLRDCGITFYDVSKDQPVFLQFGPYGG